ncbi:hypothetical protein JXM83_03230 [Candidatus Woesearchaeota archaeon]|nr:hypothetical protein [Candidatus Woesearchaeota archaeon]
MFFTIQEIFDVLAMTFIVGFIFKDHLSANKVFNRPYQVFESFQKTQSNMFWKDMKTAVLIAAPAIILHEMGHKFVALAFGFNATFHAAYTWLVIALVLKLMSFGFIFIVPAYVASFCVPGSAFCSGSNYYLARSLISIAGPFVNFLLWIVPMIIVKNNLLSKKNKHFLPVLLLTSKINFFLMLFNLIPLPGFDGANFFGSLFNFISSIM